MYKYLGVEETNFTDFMLKLSELGDQGFRLVATSLDRGGDKVGPNTTERKPFIAVMELEWKRGGTDTELEV